MVDELNLNEEEEKQRAIANQPIPQRRFGSRVTRQTQEEVIRQKKQAEQNIQQIQQERQRLEEQKRQQGSVSAENDRRSRLQRVIERVSRGKSVGGEFKQLSPEERTLVTQQAQEAERIIEKRRVINARLAVLSAEQSASQSLIPEVREQIYRQAYEEPRQTRFVIESRRGQSQIQQQFNPLPEGISIGTGTRGGVLITTGEFGQTRETFRKVETLPDRPREKLIVPKIRGVVEENPSFIPVEEEFRMQSEEAGKSFAKKAERFRNVGVTQQEAEARAGQIVEAGSFLNPGRSFVFAGSTIEKLIIGQKTTKIEKIGTALILVPPFISQTLKFGKPLIFREPAAEPLSKSLTKIVNLRREGEEPIDLAQFVIKTTKERREAIVMSRSQEYQQLIKELFIKPELPLSERRILAGGKRIVIEKESASVVRSTPMIIREGQIVSDAKTFSIKGTAKRTEPVVVSELSGVMARTEKPLGLIDINKLSQSEKEAIKKIVESRSRRPISDENFMKILRRQTEVERGEVISKDIYKIFQSGKTKEIPEGRQVRIGDITALTNKEIMKFEISNKPIGKAKLTEISVTKSDIAIIDISLPLKKPRKIPNIKDITIRAEFELPPKSEPSQFIKGIKPKRNQPLNQILREQDIANEKALLNYKLSTALKSQQSLKSIPKSDKQILAEAGFGEQRRIAELPKMVGGGSKITSSYLGTGRYEITGGGLLPKAIIKDYSKNFQPSISPTKEIIIDKTIIRTLPREQAKNITKEINKTIPREIAREISRLTPREIAREISRLTPREIAREVPRTHSRNVPRLITRIQRTPKRSIKIPAKFNIKPISLGKDLMEGFKTFVINSGKKVYLSGIRTKGQALKLGQSETLTKLRATFGIEPTKIKIKAQNYPFAVSKAFREYKIRSGKRIPLRDIFIQKTRKEGGLPGGRLASRSEVAEILSLRRRK